MGTSVVVHHRHWLEAGGVSIAHGTMHNTCDVGFTELLLPPSQLLAVEETPPCVNTVPLHRQMWRKVPFRDYPTSTTSLSLVKRLHFGVGWRNEAVPSVDCCKMHLHDTMQQFNVTSTLDSKLDNCTPATYRKVPMVFYWPLMSNYLMCC